jgi:elongation factor G
MKREFKVEANVGAPQVAYRETITKPTESTTPTRSSPVVRVSSPASRSASSREPRPRASCSKQDRRRFVPKEYIPGVEKGIEVGHDSGPLAGFPMLDVKVTLIDGAYHDVDSSSSPSKSRSRAASAKAIQKAGSAAARADHEGRGGDAGRIHRRHHRRPELTPRPDAGPGVARQRRGDQRHVPLANMFGYVNNLRSMSQGRAQYTMLFDHYSEVPRTWPRKIQAKYA